MLLVTESLDLIVHLFSMQCFVFLLCHNTFALVMIRRSGFYSKVAALLFPISLHCCFRKRCIIVTNFAVLSFPISLYFQFPLTTDHTLNRINWKKINGIHQIVYSITGIVRAKTTK